MKKFLFICLSIFISLSCCNISFNNCQNIFSVQYQNDQFSILEGYYANNCCFGCFNNTITTNGWSTLYVNTSNKCSSSIQARCAGYLEGYLTKDLIYLYLKTMNQYQQSFFQQYPKIEQQINQFVDKNILFTKEMVSKNSDSPYFNQLGFILDQLEGMVDGYNQNQSKSNTTDFFSLYNLNSGGFFLPFFFFLLF